MTSKKQSSDWQLFFDRIVEQGQLLQLTFSNPRKGVTAAARVTVRPIKLKSGLSYQLESNRDNKAFHENVSIGEAADRLKQTMGLYKQALVKTPEADVQILVSNKGELSMHSRAPTSKATAPVQEHNRSKVYTLPEGVPVPFLVQLGVMTAEGRVVKAKYDKFRQINRFLEMVSDVVPHLPTGRTLTIIDFGCGKSYLTFALYHLLAIKEKLPVRIIGLDLKRDVIEACSKLAEALGWDQLTFSVGDISDFNGQEEADMVVTLHACDTATDAALLKAVGWGASVILSVPCCQHELFRQLDQPVLKPLLKHGILKERFSALVTDAVRAQWLEMKGYRTQLLEFIDLEHTPKNLLIRAVKGSRGDHSELMNDYVEFRDFLHINPFLNKYI